MSVYDFSRIDKRFLRQRAVMKWTSDDPEVIPLSLADIDFTPPGFIKETLHKAVEEDYSPYSYYNGRKEVLETLAQKLRERNRLESSIDDILIVPGTMFSLYLISQTFLNPGDEVIIYPSPVYGPLFLNAEKAGAIVQHCPYIPGDTQTNMKALEKLISPRTRMIMICNPHNPTGRIIPKNELESLAGLALKHDILLFSDELYEDMAYTPGFVSLGSLSPQVRQKTLTVFGVSKAFGIPGYRVAYITGDSLLMRRLKAASTLMIVHTDTLAQAALQSTIHHGEVWLRELNMHLKEMSGMVCRRLNALPDIQCESPQATPFVFPDITGTGLSSDAVTQILREECKIVVQSGTWFGPLGEGNIRLNIATSGNILRTALKRIESRFQNPAQK